MTIDRLYHSFMLMLQRTGTRRADYCRKHGIFHHMGKNISIQSRVLPLYPELISLHDNVHIASGVKFITHDISHRMLNLHPDVEKNDFQEMVGCIEIMNNVFIGTNVLILHNVRIGSNVIIAAGSVVTKDLAPNGVYAGVPARRIESFDEYLKKIALKPSYPRELRPKGQKASAELANYMWEIFEKKGQEQET